MTAVIDHTLMVICRWKIVSIIGKKKHSLFLFSLKMRSGSPLGYTAVVAKVSLFRLGIHFQFIAPDKPSTAVIQVAENRPRLDHHLQQPTNDVAKRILRKIKCSSDQANQRNLAKLQSRRNNWLSNDVLKQLQFTRYKTVRYTLHRAGDHDRHIKSFPS